MIDLNLKTSASVEINATAEQVWDAMTNPEKIKIYLFGTEAVTDWQVGSPIIFQGVYEGYEYKDKGNVLQNIPNELFEYNYLAQYSGLEDKIKNYSIVTYEIKIASESSVLLTWHQAGFADRDKCEHTTKGLQAILEQIKSIAESK